MRLLQKTQTNYTPMQKVGCFYISHEDVSFKTESVLEIQTIIINCTDLSPEVYAAPELNLAVLQIRTPVIQVNVKEGSNARCILPCVTLLRRADTQIVVQLMVLSHCLLASFGFGAGAMQWKSAKPVVYNEIVKLVTECSSHIFVNEPNFSLFQTKSKKFRKLIVCWIKASGFSKTVVLSSSHAYQRDDQQLLGYSVLLMYLDHVMLALRVHITDMWYLMDHLLDHLKGRIGTFCGPSNFGLSSKGFKPKYPTPSLHSHSPKHMNSLPDHCREVDK